MVQQKLCDSCGENHTCHEVYRRVGRTEGPSVVPRVLTAFAAPIFVFIGSLAVFGHLLGDRVKDEGLRTILTFFGALSVTFAAILVIKAVNRRVGKKR